MPSLGSLLFSPISAASKVGTGIFSATATNRTIGMMAVGSGIGAIGGAAQGYDTNSALEGASKGAFYGMLGGGAIATGLNNIFNPRMYMSTAKVGLGIGWVGAKAAKSAGKHWEGLAIAGGIAVGGVAAINNIGDDSLTSPTLQGIDTNTNYNQQAIAATNISQIGQGRIGTPQQMQGQFQRSTMIDQLKEIGRYTPAGRLRESTEGLVQGLHSGRH